MLTYNLNVEFHHKFYRKGFVFLVYQKYVAIIYRVVKILLFVNF
jgi:hypothetical protein